MKTEPSPLVAHYLGVIDLVEFVVRRRLPSWAMFRKGLNDAERLALAEKFAAAHAVNDEQLADAMNKVRG